MTWTWTCGDGLRRALSFVDQMFKQWAPVEKNLIIFPGVCLPGTVGHRVLNKEAVVKVRCVVRCLVRCVELSALKRITTCQYTGGGVP